ncbi:MAG: hypothetical protein E7370_06575 [Clostridiales bacterium]|nr:hypothetical protein [Clostridiales bacterium]
MNMNKKRIVLIVSNALALLFCIIMVIICESQGIRNGADAIRFYFCVFFVFVFSSLIVYYLSIIANALSRRAKELEEREKKINEKK